MSGDLITAMNVANSGAAAAKRYAVDYAVMLMARHLRSEHGWGVRRIGTELGLTDKRVKELCGEGKP